MGIFDNTSEITKKFITIVLCLTVILFIFTVIVGLWIALGKPSPVQTATGTNESSDTHILAIHYDKSLPDFVLQDGSTYVSMIKAAGIVMKSEGGLAWVQGGHPDYRLYQAEASLIDIQGLSYRWSLIFMSNGSMLMAEVEDGQAMNVLPQEIEGLEIPPASSQLIYDSNSIMDLMATNLSINAQSGNMLFSMKYSDDDGLYSVNYRDPSSSAPYEIIMGAASGNITESTYRGTA